MYFWKSHPSLPPEVSCLRLAPFTTQDGPTDYRGSVPKQVRGQNNVMSSYDDAERCLLPVATSKII